MATTYAELRQKVRDWSNRDAEALPNTVIQDSLRWAADTAYRELRVPPLEYTQQYVIIGNEDENDDNIEPSDAEQIKVNPASAATLGYTSVSLPVPSDATVFIQLRISGRATKLELPAVGLTTLDDGKTLEVLTGGLNSVVVFNEKVDVRTFHDAIANKVSEAYWTRQQDNLLVTGRINPGDVLELYYFRRLPALDARYALDTGDFDDEFVPIVGSSFVDTVTGSFTRAEITTYLDPVLNPDVEPSRALDDFFQPSIDADIPLDEFWLGTHIFHWLRDQNERILIFGALNECFAYLADDAQGSKYLQKYLAEIQELNKEEKMRKSSGGNVQVHYNSYII